MKPWVAERHESSPERRKKKEAGWMEERSHPTRKRETRHLVKDDSSATNRPTAKAPFDLHRKEARIHAKDPRIKLKASLPGA
jgi:hypothetical protein